MVSPYPLSPLQNPGAPSPDFSPPGQELQNILQPTQQYYMTMSSPSYSLATASMPGQARRTIQQPAEPHYTMSMSPLSAVNMVVILL
ncbi:hypothetical protein P692DRAFT_20756983 [Suillus brevipes Sb2]|nr:hypothetical protein P692DRAFT_20756983 [Suillus brevipes Sb2]